MADNKLTAIPRSTSPTQDPLNKGIDDECPEIRPGTVPHQILKNVRSGEAIAGNELWKKTYSGAELATWGTFHVQISKLNKQLKALNLKLVSTTWHRLVRTDDAD